MTVSGSGCELLRMKCTGTNRHTANCFMCAVVDDNMHQILRPVRADHRHCPEMHQSCAVAVHAPDPLRRLAERDAQRDRRGVPHGADRQEIVFVALPVRLADLEQFAAGLACRADDRVFTGDRILLEMGNQKVQLLKLKNTTLSPSSIVPTGFPFLAITKGSRSWSIAPVSLR